MRGIRWRRKQQRRMMKRRWRIYCYQRSLGYLPSANGEPNTWYSPYLGWVEEGHDVLLMEKERFGRFNKFNFATGCSRHHCKELYRHNRARNQKRWWE